MRISKYLVLIQGFLIISTSAMSMDITTLPANFNSFYVGGIIGSANGQSNYQTNPGCVLNADGGVFCVVSPDPSNLNGSAIAASGTGSIKPAGFTGGIQAGRNWQVDMFIFGAEADFGALELNKTNYIYDEFPFEFTGTQYKLTESISTNWMATIRGRIGLTLHPQLLLYGTSGLAFTTYKFSSSYSDNAVSAEFPGGTGNGSNSSTQAGWTAGLGGEWLLTKHFSIKAEYLYVDFRAVNVLVPLSNTSALVQTMQVQADLSVNIARFGVNYQFN